MWDNPLLAAFGLMVLLSVLFYKVNLHFLAGGHLAVMIWMVVGVPLFAISFALMAAVLHPPNPTAPWRPWPASAMACSASA